MAIYFSNTLSKEPFQFDSVGNPVSYTHLDVYKRQIVDHYMVGGIKTDAGRNRIIPIHDSILPLIHARMGGRYLVSRSNGGKYTTTGFRIGIWDGLCQRLGLNHIPHDTRYTFASLANNAGMNDVCLKIILGHSVSNASGSAFKIGGTGDVTKNVYTEKTISELVSEVNKIPVDL